jgi:hypothetical protein
MSDRLSNSDAWYKSSYSAPYTDCIEVRALPEGGLAVRDSKNPAGAALAFTPAGWNAFVLGTRSGEFGS